MLLYLSAKRTHKASFALLIRGCGGTADALVSGSSVERRVGSNPVIRTKQKSTALVVVLFCFGSETGFEGEAVLERPSGGRSLPAEDRARSSRENQIPSSRLLLVYLGEYPVFQIRRGEWTSLHEDLKPPHTTSNIFKVQLFRAFAL